MARVCDGFHQSITAVIFKETDVLHSKKTSINLADAVNSAPQESGSNLTFSELSRAYCLAICDGSDLRLRKWVSAYGETQAWAFSSEQIEMASQAMIDHGYCPSTVNRDIGTIGSVYKWAKSKHLSPRDVKLWTSHATVDKLKPQFEARSNASGLTPPKWLWRRVRL